MSHRPHVALDVETSLIYGRQILDGVASYLSGVRPWSVYLEQQELGARRQELLQRWHGDGIITRHVTPEFAEALRERQVAVVDLDDIHEGFGFPKIESAHAEIGALAAEHLLERGFTNFAACSFSGECWSQKRMKSFVLKVKNTGHECTTYEHQGDRLQRWRSDEPKLVNWLRSLPSPVGVFATNDLQGQRILEVCAREGLAAPEAVAVIGVDNDELLCGLSQPPLSSVIPNPKRVGFEAAALLHRLMSGESPPVSVLEVPPLGVATRQSTDILAIDDPDLATVLRYIREHACDGISVQDVLAHAPISRSQLERGFRKFLQRSPQAEIRNVQIKRAKELLATTDLTLSQISRLTGISHAEYLSVVFKRETGETPGQYRRRSQDRK